MTIIDVAKAAGVSVATVSRVINKNGAVSLRTAQRVERVIRETGYVPNQAARNLRKHENMTVTILAPNFTNPYYSHILAGIGDAGQELGYSVFIRNIQFGRPEIEDIMRNQRADGLVLLAGEHNAEWLAEYAAEAPIVQCCEYVEGIGLPQVSIDNYRAAYEATEYLLNLGHRRIASILADNGHISTGLRQRGYQDALRDAGVPLRPQYTVKASPDYSYNSGYIMANKLLSLPERPTAIFAISDILALSAIAAAADRGLSVPADLSVIGFDDVDYTTMFHPHLTTVAQPCYEIGRLSIIALHEFKKTFPSPPAVPFMPHRLILRESAMPCVAR
ncbi:MAG: LacI family DNA-binding transcriptional regulator [Oscillospiraceae bacterium]|jgi:DNA-binding LacI/PurR family transcriptional regulator|nr:LacI family DNA-binding transcriptional regulator [Oscillospiraceae bacterium]